MNVADEIEGLGLVVLILGVMTAVSGALGLAWLLGYLGFWKAVAWFWAAAVVSIVLVVRVDTSTDHAEPL